MIDRGTGHRMTALRGSDTNPAPKIVHRRTQRAGIAIPATAEHPQ